MAVKLASGSAYIALLIAFCSLCLVRTSYAIQHVVGDAAGWTLPSFGHVNYTEWASNHTFEVGDSLLFTYRSDLHNVQLVTRSDYRNCSSINPLATFNDGKTVVTLTSAGSKYYICGVSGHCSLGQKLFIMVRTPQSSTASPSLGAPTKSPAPAPATSGSLSRRGFLMFIGVCLGAILEISWLL